MPWKASSSVDLKAELVARLKAGERMTDLCREYGISRQSGYSIWQRYEKGGLGALMPRSKAPHRIPHRTPSEVVELIIKERLAHPTWGPKKLKEILERRHSMSLPAPSTINNWLDRSGIVEKRPRRERRFATPSTSLGTALQPNDIWCADYKGQFRMGNREYCYPLTMTDQRSRFLLLCDGMDAISDERAQESSQRTFAKYGLPLFMRTDNGIPFASTGLAGLTRLAVFWIRLGIKLERIRPGHPQENGRHERMHRTLKRETTRPPGDDLLQQQARFDDFIDEFNNMRPHEALDMQRPADVYRPSPRPLPLTLPELKYPFHDDVATVNTNGHVTFSRGRQVYLALALARTDVGLRELDDGRWVVTFADIDLGHIDPKEKHTLFKPIEPTT